MTWPALAQIVVAVFIIFGGWAKFHQLTKPGKATWERP